MAATELLELAKSGDFEKFERRCLEALEGGGVELAQLAGPFRQLEKQPLTARVATLGQVILEQRDARSDPGAALAIARVSLLADPQNSGLRSRVVTLYRDTFEQRPGLGALLDLSGLEAGRPVRSAMRLLDFCLSANPGDILISRTEAAIVEVIDVNLAEGLITLRRDGRPRTVSALELSREYERVDPEDFRVLRQMRPERLRELLAEDPVRVIVNLVQAHEGTLDQNALKHELCPRFIAEKDWSRWWTNARTQLKRCPNITVSGRAPVVLEYCDNARTVEDETWDAFVAQRDPQKWLGLVEAYLRGKRADREEPSGDLLKRIHAHIVKYIRSIEQRRPGEAFVCALTAEKIDDVAGIVGDDVRQLAVQMLRDAADPAALIRQLEDVNLWELGHAALAAARPDDASQVAVALFRHAPAAVLDDLVELARKGERLGEIQNQIDAALLTPHEFPEVTYWLWKGPDNLEGLRGPTTVELFQRIIETLSSLGRSLQAPVETTRRFRMRAKAALGLKDFARVRKAIGEHTAAAAITLRRTLERMDGLGDNTPARMLDLLRDVHPALWRVTTARIEPWADASIIWTSRAGLQKKTEERDHLVNVTMRDNARRIGEAASYGDLSENSEYKFALEERDLLRARLAQMNNELSLAQVIEPDDIPRDRVGVGTRVKLRRTRDGHEFEITFLGPFDAEVERGVYNYRAPMSQKLMGIAIGERVQVGLNGPDEEHEVIAVAPGA